MKRLLSNWLMIMAAVFLFGGCHSRQPVRFRIGVSQCSDDEWRAKMNDEIMREALFYDGLKIDIRTARDNNQKQIADIRHFIDCQVDLLIVAPNEAAAITPAVEEAFRAGIPVVIVDRKTLSDQYTAFVGADNYGIGKEVGQYIVQRLGGHGRVLEITGLEGSTPAIERHRGLTDALSASPGVTLATSVDGSWLQAIASEQMDSLIKAGEGSFDLVFAQNDRMALGAYLAARQLGQSDGMAFVGIDAVAGKGYGVELVADSVLDATFIYPTGGDRVIQVAMNILEGKPYERETRLGTALVDRTTARILQLQADYINERDDRIEHLNSRLDEFLSRYSAQRMFLYATLVSLLLFATLLAFIVRAYWTKNRMNLELSQQKKQLEQQRDQLVSLSRQLEEATHAKLVFFTNVSHDFRTPLTLVADPIERLLADASLASDQHSLLEVAHKNVAILLRLVNQILDFRKYENGKLTLTRTDVDLCAQLREWSQSFRTLARTKQIHFRLELPASDGVTEDCCLALDVEKMERIYFNLLSNAFKFTPPNGTITVTLSSITGTTGDKQVQLVVADTGTGISAQHIRHIFDRFYQMDTQHASGSGIGLALVKAFVELHEGTISVDSLEGKGTAFTVTLPVVKESSSSVPAVCSARITEAVVNDELGDIATGENPASDDQPMVLIVDDNADVRQYVRSLLQSHYTVIEAVDGQDGFKQALKHVPDAVVCDVMMPVMDGLECCRRLKAEVQTSHIPVMLLTACSLDEQRIQGFECGADSYIAKPFRSALLQTRLRNLIDNRKRLKHVFDEGGVSSSAEPTGDMDKDFLDRFRRLVEENLSDSELSVEALGVRMGLSRVQLYRKLKALTNFSPVELLRMARLKKASSLLASTDKTVSEITYEVGFTSPSYFTKCYKEQFGESPSDFLKRKNGISKP